MCQCMSYILTIIIYSGSLIWSKFGVNLIMLLSISNTLTPISVDRPNINVKLTTFNVNCFVCYIYIHMWIVYIHVYIYPCLYTYTCIYLWAVQCFPANNLYFLAWGEKGLFHLITNECSRPMLSSFIVCPQIAIIKSKLYCAKIATISNV